jgi:hypothetical protein
MSRDLASIPSEEWDAIHAAALANSPRFAATRNPTHQKFALAYLLSAASTEETAQAIGTTARSIQRWLAGDDVPAMLRETAQAISDLTDARGSAALDLYVSRLVDRLHRDPDMRLTAIELKLLDSCKARLGLSPLLASATVTSPSDPAAPASSLTLTGPADRIRAAHEALRAGPKAVQPYSPAPPATAPRAPAVDPGDLDSLA